MTSVSKWSGTKIPWSIGMAIHWHRSQDKRGTQSILHHSIYLGVSPKLKLVLFDILAQQGNLQTGNCYQIWLNLIKYQHFSKNLVQKSICLTKYDLFGPGYVKTKKNAPARNGRQRTSDLDKKRRKRRPCEEWSTTDTSFGWTRTSNNQIR